MTTSTRPPDTPAGPFTIVVGADGAVLAGGFTADSESCCRWCTRACAARCGSAPTSAR